MSIQAPQGILNIPNATLRVGKLSVDEVVGADTILNTVARNTILLVDDVAYHENKNWALKLPNAWAGEFECNTASAGNYSEFNFYNEGASSNAQGYNLTFNDTTVELRYDGSLLKTETLASTVTGTGVRKVQLMFERNILSVTVDGTLVFTYTDTSGPRPRVYSTTAGGFLNFFTNGGAIKNLKIVNEKWMSDGTSNIAYVGGGEVAVGKALAFNRVSNVSQIKVDSNVVTEYTGPHDRPLRKYPEVALTADAETASGYKGYKVSTSNGFSNDINLNIWRIFNGLTGNEGWVTDAYLYDSSNDFEYISSGTSTLGGVSGEWVKLELPTKIRLSRIVMTARDLTAEQHPEDFQILGSNDDSNWTQVMNVLGAPFTRGSTLTFNVTGNVEHFRYLAVIVTRTVGHSAAAISELEYYGHEEGSGSLDTTLKSVYNVPATTGTQLEVYYDGRETSSYTGSGTTVTDISPNTNNGTLNGGVGFDSTYKAFTFDGTTTRNITTTLPSSVTGEYVHSVSLWVKADEVSRSGGVFTFFTIGSASSANMIALGVNTAGDGIKYDFYNAGAEVKSPQITNDEWMHFVVTYSGGANNLAGAKRIYLNGKELSVIYDGANVSSPLSLPTSPTLTLGGQINSSNPPFSGSIANFRLYSKVLNADQVKELYDYQKDYFLGSKSQVTLYKGHLGVGVTEPSGQLELAGDERIQEYPPRGMTGYETLVEGHGVFEMYSTGGLYNNGSGGNLPWTVFNKITGTFNDGSSWVSEDAAGAGAGGNYNNGGSSGYGGSNRLSSNTPLGDYIVICLPYSIVLKSYSLSNLSGASGYGAADFPRDYIIYGSNDDVNWEVVDSRSDQEAGGLAPAAHVSAGYLGYTNNYTVSENNKVYYKFAIVITDINAQSWYNYSNPINASYAAISEWRLFGTPGPTTLDKGSLTLGRSLDVPRISRYDVDTETPRPEKLVVDYDTTVNSSPTDISGQGNHGVFYNDAYYSAAEKAFVFDGTGDYIQGNLNNTGDTDFTVSCWFKRTADAGSECVWFIGGESTSNPGNGVGLEMMTLSDGSGYFFFYSGYEIDDTDLATVIGLNKWVHLVCTRVGNTMKIYLNGEDRNKPVTGTAHGLSLDANTEFRIGQRNSSGTNPAHGMVSNFKIYNVVLEPSEVKKLYNLGRTGRSMVISDTAVGIGKVPEAQLDVRGAARFDSFTKMLRINHPGNQLSISRTDTEFRWYAWASGCNWFTPYTGKSIYVGRDGQTIDEFDFYNVTTVKKGGSTIHSSDDRLKRDETFITNATDTLLKLKPQTYIKKHRLSENENDTDIPEQFEAGLIAQDVWYDAPELRFLVHPSKDANPSETKPVSPDPNDPTQDPDYSSWGTTQAYVNYEGFLPYLIKSNQEIYNELQAEKARNDALEARILALEGA